MREMKRTFSFLLFLLAGGVQSSTLYQWIVDSQTRFNYDPNPNNALGVYNWPRTYGEDCGGEHQSPVDIQTDLVRYGVSCQCPRMIYSSNILRGKFKNNGHSAEFEPEDERMLQLTNVPYRSGMYKLHDFHLHYGGVTGRDFELQGLRFRGSGIMSAGSEHTIDGLRFEGELHFVFYNSNYKDLEEADNKTDGVVVIVVMIQKIQGSMANSGETSRFSEFLEMNIPRIFPYQANASTEVDLTMFFNRDCEFYTYAGSTTTPTCHESVRWIILKDPIMVTEEAWFLLTGLQSRGDFNSRFGNYRTTQPLNDRVIEANFDRPNGPVRPSPNGEALMMMMLEMINMTMEMMNQDLNIQNMPMMLMGRSASSPVGNVRDMPLMLMSMLQSTNMPSLNGNTQNIPMMIPMLRDANVPNLNGNVRGMPMMLMPMQKDENVPNLNGNMRDMPMMMPMQKDAKVPNLNGNVRDMSGNTRKMQMMMTPTQTDANLQNRNGNMLEMPKMSMSMLNSPNIPNLVDTMPTMMPTPANVPGMPMLMMPIQRDLQVPNLNGNVPGRVPMGMPNIPVFDRNVATMMSPGMGRRGNGPNLDGNVRGIQRPGFSMQTDVAGQRSSVRNNNRNNNMNNENNNNNSNNNNNNNNNNGMMSNMQNLRPLLWNLWR
ncbi:uncharacterized protein LOC123535688 [Mercenaria mercenaria]|uniref:uncharacterized protein LOC123535688 n=1 Tax=Mercenaria mercenaria TaxID=6596 RepID=UPI00234F49D5|nr:uncharacterized protein LOC123535688 [Mercenaria mercenaria]